jgi:DisA bacterial checkpoint controller nucleotide-binding
MKDTITHFMWGYQRHFRHAIERETERILDSLKPGLKPRVFLIGVRISHDDTLRLACVEPEVHHWAQSADFYDVLSDVDPFLESYPESQIYHSDPIAQSNADDRLFRRALRDAVLRRLEVSPSRPEGLRLFASWPVKREGFLVVTIITVSEQGLDEVPFIASDTIRIHEYRSRKVPRSLAEAVIDQILAKTNSEIIQPDAGAGLGVLGSGDELIRQAGQRFFSGLLYRIDQDSMLIGVTEELFDTLSRLSLTPYERAEAKGTLIFAPGEAAIGNPVLILADPVRLRDVRGLRKLLVLANNDLFLRCDSIKAFALIRIPESHRAEISSSVEVRVGGRGQWSVSFDKKVLMVLKDGRPALPQPAVDEQQIAQDLRRLIPRMAVVTANLFAQIASCLAISGHGSLIVISERADEEAIRLGNESLPITPLLMQPELAATLGKIDGALLCDPDGNCHAIGVILDGSASASGDRGRGSRFNSAVRYVDSSPGKAVAMVVSEDGGLDLLPRLKPVLSQDEVVVHLNELRTLALEPGTLLNREREVDVIHWLTHHSYYLSDEQCNAANEWIRACHERFRQDSDIWIEPAPLRPDVQFQPSRDLV